MGQAMPHPKLQLRRFPRRPVRKAVWLGCAAGMLSRLLQRRLPKPTAEDLSQHEYSTSTQRIGVRFTDRIRDTFRFRWLRRTR
jgi:trans-aconitate methyltransferase